MKAAILGAGRMGAVHTQACANPSVEIALVTDTRPEAAAALAERFGARTVASGEWDDALARYRPELVVVAATVPAHAPAVLAAAAGGAKYVFCEKPIGGSLAECHAMIGACARAGAALGIAPVGNGHPPGRGLAAARTNSSRPRARSIQTQFPRPGARGTRHGALLAMLADALTTTRLIAEIFGK